MDRVFIFIFKMKIINIYYLSKWKPKTGKIKCSNLIFLKLIKNDLKVINPSRHNGDNLKFLKRFFLTKRVFSNFSMFKSCLYEEINQQ